MIQYNYYQGVRGVRFIWHGEWGDPEVSWHGYVANYHVIEEHMWNWFKEELGLDDRVTDIEDGSFSAFCREHAKELKDIVKEYAIYRVEY